MVADTRKQIQSMQKSPLGRELVDAAQQRLALWKRESNDRTGIHVFQPQAVALSW